MSLTTDPNDPRLTRGNDTTPVEQAPVYLVLSDEERAKGFVRPVRPAYVHVGDKPKHPTRGLTADEQERYGMFGYVAFEPALDNDSPITGRFWKQVQLDGNACGKETVMGRTLAETYARDPLFYGGTYCVHCQMHRPVAEFQWLDGSVVGS